MILKLKPNRIKPQITSELPIWPDQELLANLLALAQIQGNPQDWAQKLLSRFGNLRQLVNSDQKLLQDMQLEASAISAIAMVREIIICTYRQNLEEKIILAGWKDLLDYCYVVFDGLKNEQLRIFYLNQNQQLIADELHFKKQSRQVNMVEIDIAKIVHRSVLFSASALILAHNHPSFNIEPSRSDIDNTHKIIAALKAKNIKLHDHLIIGHDQYYSFRNHGLI